MSEILINVIIGTVILLGSCIALTVSSAWTLGGKYYIKGNFARRKSWIERLLDGFEILAKM